MVSLVTQGNRAVPHNEEEEEEDGTDVRPQHPKEGGDISDHTQQEGPFGHLLSFYLGKNKLFQ